MACMRDLIVGALDTTNAALEHGILHMCLQPEIQRKVQAEIDQVVGTARQPRYEDRKSMPYTQAVLWEILRSLTPVPMTVRCSLKDVQVQGERVPKVIFAIEICTFVKVMILTLRCCLILRMQVLGSISMPFITVRRSGETLKISDPRGS